MSNTLYLLLPGKQNRDRTSISEGEIIEFKPGLFGITLNIKVLITRLAKWWLKKFSGK